MDVQSDSAGGLGDHGAGFESVVDSLDGVVFHSDEETGGELGVGSAGVEQSWRGVSEVFGGHEIVGFDCLFNVVAVNADRNTHDHMLRTFSHLTINPQKVGTLFISYNNMENIPPWF